MTLTHRDLVKIFAVGLASVLVGSCQACYGSLAVAEPFLLNGMRFGASGQQVPAQPLDALPGSPAR